MPMSAICRELGKWGSLVKFSHSIFALPFALSMLVVVWRMQPVTLLQCVAIVICVVAARTAAMAFNRLVDAGIDARNPRTQNRELPREIITRKSVMLLFAASAAVFLAGSAVLGMHCFVLSPAVLALLCGYSLTKRFTRWSHLFLGASLACAPGGVWYALRGTFDTIPLLLMIGVAFWVAGFDMLYACQDVEFDRASHLHSVAAKIGVARTLRLAVGFHIFALVFFALFGAVAQLGIIYFAGLVAFGMVVLSQHRLVSANDLSKIDAAFFTRNGIASALFLLAVVSDVVFYAVRC